MLITASEEFKFINWPELAPFESYSKRLKSPLLSLSWSKNNIFLLCLEQGGYPEIVSLKDGNCIKPVHIITAIDCATTALFSHTRNKIIGIGSKSSVVIYDTSTKAVTKFFAMPGLVDCMDFNINDCYIASVCRNGEVMIIDLVGNTVEQHCHLQQTPTALHFHPYIDDIFGVSTLYGQFTLYDINAVAPLWTIVEPENTAVVGFAFCPDLERSEIVLVYENHKIAIHAMTGKCIFRLTMQYPACAVDFAFDGKTFLIGLANGAVCVFETLNPRTPKHILMFHSSPVTCIKFSNIGQKPPVSTYQEPVSSSSSMFSFCDNDDPSTLSNNPTQMCQQDDALIDALKADITNDLRLNFAKFNANLSNQISSFAEFMQSEFEKVKCDVENKYDLMNLVRASWGMQPAEEESQSVITEQGNIFDPNGTPLILE